MFVVPPVKYELLDVYTYVDKFAGDPNCAVPPPPYPSIVPVV